MLYTCILCDSGRGSGGLLFNYENCWFGIVETPPEECPRCGSHLGLMPANEAPRAQLAAEIERLNAENQDLRLTLAIMLAADQNLNPREK